MTIIDAALNRTRTVMMILTLILISGVSTYFGISKESFPDITIPSIYVSLTHEGISPEDADKLLIRPVYQELQGLDGIDKIESNASLGHAGITLSFFTGTDINQALIDVRERVDKAKVELPEDTEEPNVMEFNLALFPIIVLTLSGDVDERLLLKTGEFLKDKIESIPDVLEAEIQGSRDEIVEILVDPVELANYNIELPELFQLVSNNNRLIAAGTLDTGQGRHAIKLPGLLKTVDDLLEMPVKSEDDKVVRFRDAASAIRSFKDPVSIARINGKPTITLEISKRVGTNIIETIDEVKRVVAEAEPFWPEGIKAQFTQDQSLEVKSSLEDLINNVAFATLLVMLVIVASLGFSSATLVGIAIPGSFLTALICLSVLGFTLNMVVLFALILAVGLLVDGAIVVTEYADRKMAEGNSPKSAFAQAAKRMAWPIIASTATTLAVFMPLMYWPDMMGEFMKYLPITLIFTLIASLAMALIFVPTLGSLVARPGQHAEKLAKSLVLAEKGDLKQITGITGRYVATLERLLHKPGRVLLAAPIILVLVIMLYATFGRGVEFFPSVDAAALQVQIRARGDFSIYERDELVEEVEAILLEMPELHTVYANTLAKAPNDRQEDTIGFIQIELTDWRMRRSSKAIIEDIRQRTDHIAGVIIKTEEREDGPAQGADIQFELISDDLEKLEQATADLTGLFDNRPELVDVNNSLPISGLEWVINVDRAEASRFGADISVVGNMVKMITNGINVGNFRPDDAVDEVEIIFRFPRAYRNLDQLDRLTVATPQGQIPVSNFITRSPKQKVSKITKTGDKYSLQLEANTVEGVLPDNLLAELQNEIAKVIPEGVFLNYSGNQEKQNESQDFLQNAFMVALFVMAIILVTQFNSFYQALLILSAVIFSTIGVFIGLLLKDEPFGIVMSGVGVISLAGIVVNNNIVLIDTYNHLRRAGMEAFEAALRTGAQRFRPVMLTTITTILGLLPMVFQLNINFIQHETTVGAPSSQWWSQLSTAIAGGLAFATLLTLFLTPCLLLMGTRFESSQSMSSTESPTEMEGAS